MSYMALSGLLTAKNNTFVNFNTKCGTTDYVLSTDPDNSDGSHPVDFIQSKIYNVDNSSKVWQHRPSLAEINSADCVDMNCDGLKKCIFTDKDGTFLGQPGVVISESEWEWNGDPARGLGDYRIPKEALSDDNGHMKNITDVYKYRGIVRDENLCEYRADWQSWHCNFMTMKMLIIESMDNDTEKRRLSPVAIFSDDNKYVDLINGPQDHGWCFG